MPTYSYQGIRPVVHPDAFVHETAVLIGDVIIEAGCYVAPCAVMRGDFGRIVIRQGANVQDTCVIHSFPEHDCVVEVDGHIGHGAILHCCTIGRNALVGMNAVVMDYADIGAESIIGAASFVAARFQCEARSLVMGAPATVRRSLSDKDVAWKSEATGLYQALARRCAESLEPTTPLTEAEADRARVEDIGIRPKHSG